MSNVSADALLKGLNQQQREAVEHINGPLLIIAGPGSGKTRVITHRIAYLIRVTGISPHRIAALTFTNKAAKEMRQRISVGTPEDHGGAPLSPLDNRYVTISTFHTFCASVLRRDGETINIPHDYSIYDDGDQMATIKRCMKDAGIDTKQFSARAILSRISNAKSQFLNAEGFAMTQSNYYEELVSKVFERYDASLRAASAVDFDDLLLRTWNLFDKHPETSKKYHKRFVHLMVDEFQDTNIVQYALAKQLSQTYKNLCVVGDPDQSIYSWRNADIRNILSFQHDHPDAKAIALEQNYRSSKTILKAASSLISVNKERVQKALFTTNSKGGRIVVVETGNEREEAQAVLREIQSLVRSLDYRHGDIAVMYRVNAQSRALEEACLRYGINYQLVGSLRFYHRQEIKDLVAYLRLIANPDDEAAFTRIVNTPSRGIGERTLAELTRAATQMETSLYRAIESFGTDQDQVVPLPTRSITALKNFHDLIESLRSEGESSNVVDLVEAVLDKTGYKSHVLDDMEQSEDRWENIQEMKSTARDYADIPVPEALTAFLERVALVSDTDSLEDKSDAITLITLHQAKGLEYPVVFIVGMEEGLLPHSRSLDDESELEEERRLAYVGITRAKERLYLFRAFRRGFRGISEPNLPSRFLMDIPRNLIVPANVETPQVKAVVSERNSTIVSTDRDIHTKSVSPTKGRRRRGANRHTKDHDGQQSASFTIGDKVRHTTFGEGVVMSCKPSGSDMEVTVAFKDNNGIKRLLLSFAPLEKVS